MDEHDDWLAQRFEENRTHLRAVAYRMLGSISEADDAVQEAWLRLSRSDTSGIENLGGWLTTLIEDLDGACVQTASARRGAPIILTVDAAAMHAASHAFYQAANGVWLTDHVPPGYLSGCPG
jgi:DNA-directed RNA polymerase specialized sigma24 family protein